MRLTEATGSTNPVQVRLPVVRNIQVDHKVDFVCIDTSGRLEEQEQEQEQQEEQEQEDQKIRVYLNTGREVKEWCEEEQSRRSRRRSLTRSVEMRTLHWYCFNLDMASSLWS